MLDVVDCNRSFLVITVIVSVLMEEQMLCSIMFRPQDY